jgi:hypothetical protein
MERYASEHADGQANGGANQRISGGAIVAQAHNYQGGSLHEILSHLGHGLLTTVPPGLHVSERVCGIRRRSSLLARRPSAGAMPDRWRPAERDTRARRSASHPAAVFSQLWVQGFAPVRTPDESRENLAGAFSVSIQKSFPEMTSAPALVASAR